MDENDLIAWHYDHCENRNIKGINMLNCLYNVGDISIPTAFELILKPVRHSDLKTRRKKRRSEVTKNELVRSMTDTRKSKRFSRIDHIEQSEQEAVTGQLKGMKFPVRLVRQIFTNKDGSADILYLARSQLTADWNSITTIYKK